MQLHRNVRLSFTINTFRDFKIRKFPSDQAKTCIKTCIGCSGIREKNLEKNKNTWGDHSIIVHMIVIYIVKIPSTIIVGYIPKNIYYKKNKIT